MQISVRKLACVVAVLAVLFICIEWLTFFADSQSLIKCNQLWQMHEDKRHAIADADPALPRFHNSTSSGVPSVSLSDINSNLPMQTSLAILFSGAINKNSPLDAHSDLYLLQRVILPAESDGSTVHVYISTGGIYPPWNRDSILQRFQRVFGHRLKQLNFADLSEPTQLPQPKPRPHNDHESFVDWAQYHRVGSLWPWVLRHERMNGHRYMYIMRVRMDSCVTPKRASLTARSPPLKQWKLEVDAAHAFTFGGIGQVDGYFKCPNIRWPREACDTAWYDIAFVIGRVFASAFIPTLESAFIYPWQPEDWANACVKERGGSNLHSKGTQGLTISAECVLAMHARSIGPVYELSFDHFSGAFHKFEFDGSRSPGREFGCKGCDAAWASHDPLSDNITALLK